MVGGGLLGLQVARALSVRGVDTEVVEGTEHLLSAQVDERGGSVLKRDLRKLGTQVYTGARAVRLTDDGLKLDNGYTLDTDLIVLTAGGRPSTALARRAGLFVRRGVVVGKHLESITDERIHAIGDCAEHSGRVTGFVPPAWEQATILAAHLCGEDMEYVGSRSVARLRATGLDVAVLGDPEHTDGDIVEVTNPIVGTHRKLVVPGRRDRGGRADRGPVAGRPDHPALRPADDPGCPRARRAADGRAPGAGQHRAAARRGGGLRLCRGQRRPDPGLRIVRPTRGSRPGPPPAAAAASPSYASCCAKPGVT